MKMNVKIFLTVILLIGIIIISGCIGGGNKEKPLSGNENPSSANQPEGNNANLSGVKTEDKTVDAGNTVHADKNSFAYILSLGSPNYTVIYDTTLDRARGSSGITIYISGEKVRVDYVSKDARSEVESSVFKTGIKMYVCTKQLSEWSCIKFRDEIAPDLVDISNLFENDPQKPVYDGVRNIAGVAAACYKIESEGKTYRYCVHPQTYLALSAEKYAGKEPEYRMIATKVDLSAPNDSIFELPAEPSGIEITG